MLLTILFVIAIILQIIGAAIASELIRKTKFNIAWILLSLAFVLMAIQLCFRFFGFIKDEPPFYIDMVCNTLSIITSFCIVFGVLFIRKLFAYLKANELRRKRSEENILNTIIQTEEKERRRFARDLHDGIGPLLSSVKMSLSSLDINKPAEENFKIIENINLVINEAISTAKEVSKNLSPHVLDNFGLVSAIHNFYKPINLSEKIKVFFSTNLKEDRFIYNIEVVLYRVVCELVNNTLKHGKASEITIELMRHDKIISLQYSDNGIGFDIDKVMSAQKSNMGLSNIHTRIKSLKGIINIESENGNGMKVIIILNTNNIS